MKPLPLAILLLLAAGIAASLTAWLHAGADEGASRLPALEARLDELARRQAELVSGLDELARTLPRAMPAQVLPQGEIDAAVARALDQRTPVLQQPVASAAAPAAGALEEEPPVDLAPILAQLTSHELSWEEQEQLWHELRKKGLLDDVIAAFEALAAADPNDPQAQVNLGQAYLQKIQEVGGGALAGVWATKADDAFDVALELDTYNWEARFTKAVSLSFWPAVLGKQPEAIAQFETLVAQQETSPSQPHHAQTYLFLGNLYQQTGNSAKALEVWKQGLAFFPQDEDLLSHVAFAQ